MRPRAAGLALAALVLLALGARAAPPPDTAEGILSFGNALLRSGDSFRAATEYLRILHHFPDAPEALRALEGLGRAYALAGRWDEAAQAFGRLQELAPSAEHRRLWAGALYRAGRYAEAARAALVPDAGEEDRTLGTLARLRAGMGGAPGERGDLRAEYEALPRKSPAAAGLLSAVLPGAGHLYTGRPRDAAVALVLNGAFLWGTWQAARADQWALAGILGALELGWYGGTITSSMNAAHKWNRREEGRFFSRWEAGALPRWDLVFLPGGGAAVATWTW
ncbi:tetratricopeptide repeat protein [Deferrisoma sp.]